MTAELLKRLINEAHLLPDDLMEQIETELAKPEHARPDTDTEPDYVGEITYNDGFAIGIKWKQHDIPMIPVGAKLYTSQPTMPVNATTYPDPFQKNLSKLDRYDFYQPDNWDGYHRSAYMDQCEDGEYVKFDDVAGLKLSLDFKHISQWSDIETAPKDGTVIDLWLSVQNGRDRRICNAWNIGNGWRIDTGPLCKDMVFTHWMHTPKAPLK